MQAVSTTDAAALLGVSEATIRNWVRAGHLSSLTPRPLSFREEDIAALLGRIRANGFSRLRKRANKSASAALRNPGIRDRKILGDLAIFAGRLEQNEMDASHALYSAALCLLADRGEASLPPPAAEWRFENIRWRRAAVRDVMRGWLARIGYFPVPDPAFSEAFLSWRDRGADDPLGVLYQGISPVGQKSRAGAYFTPSGVIDDSLAGLGGTPEAFLDPCCGTGRYLVRAGKMFGLAPAALSGFDADPAAVDIARLNILLAYPGIDFMPSVHCLDSLCDPATNRFIGAFDAVATNPPWGGRRAAAAPGKPHGETFSLFLEKSLRLLREGGRLSFLLPEAVLKIRAHTDIRRLLAEQTRIVKISLLGRVFPGVVTPVVRLDLIKESPPENWRVAVASADGTHEAAQSRFAANARHAFDVAVAADDEYLLDKIFAADHQTLLDQAEWAMGIVTGDNARHVLKAPCGGSEPVLRGRDVRRFAPREARRHIVFRPELFQQVAPEGFFRAPEKLVYRFVSNKLVFAHDGKKTLTLNSANIVIPRLSGLGMKAALAFLNSRVFQYVFVKRFQTGKVLRGDLETLPFPLVGRAVARELELRVERCMAAAGGGTGGVCGSEKEEEELDRFVYRIFGLTDADAALLEARLESDAARLRF